MTRPIRKICANAVQMLIEALEKRVASAKPDYDKALYAVAMAECETLIGLKPLKSGLRSD